MKNNGQYIAFFDLDDTLLSKNSGRVFWDYCIQNNIYSPLEILNLGFSVLKFSTGFEDIEDFVRNWARNFRGWSIERMERVTRELFDTRLRALIRQGIREEIEKHHKAGASTVILSASTRFVCDPVKEHLNMAHVICTGLGVENNIFTGEFSSPYIFGEQKYLSAMAYCEEQGVDIASCYYYGDAFTDRFVMEGVGNPVCVNPEPKLRNYGAARGWRVVNW